MSDRYVVADDAFRLLICGVEDGVVLDVYAVADVDGTDVAAEDRTIPDAAVVADLYCTYYRRCFSEERALADDGHIAPEFLYNCHNTQI